MNNIKVGIIGAGRMGITHYSIINSHTKVEIKGIAEPSSNINSLFKKYIPELSIYKDYKELLNKIPLDAVLVCTPPNLNYQIIKTAYDLGIHVFVEKPFSTNTNQASELASLFESKVPNIFEIYYAQNILAPYLLSICYLAIIAIIIELIYWYYYISKQETKQEVQ